MALVGPPMRSLVVNVKANGIRISSVWEATQVALINAARVPAISKAALLGYFCGKELQRDW